MIKEDDQVLEMECPNCGLNATALISLWGHLSQRPDGFHAHKEPRGHRFLCTNCGIEPVIRES